MVTLTQDKRDKRLQHLEAVMASYLRRTPTSKQMAAASRPVLADKSSIGLQFSLELKEVYYPIVATRSGGAHLWDVDGNTYIDILMGLGTNLFGHNPTFIKDAIAEQLDQGIHLGAQAERVGDVAQLVSELTGMPRVTFSNTGTEAIMTAIRIARTATQRSAIALFTNSYHGHSDTTLMRAPLTEYAKKAIGRVLGRRSWLAPLGRLLQGSPNPHAFPAAPGIPKAVAHDVLVLDYGNPQSLEVIRAQQHHLAAVLVEPVQSRRLELQPRAFLEELRALTKAAGIALIFDEMVTGFRIHPGGAQAWFGIEADIATYSKIVGGGLPLSIIAGRTRFMDHIDGGMWQYGDGSAPTVKTTFFSGTFTKHPLALAAAQAALLYLKAHGPDLQTRLNLRTAALVERLNRFAHAQDIPVRFTHFGSFFAIALSQSQMSPIAVNLLSYHLLNRGIHLRLGDKGGFLSTAHTQEHVDTIVEAFQQSLSDLRKAGFL
jgi:glutamate-1-semialdehyde 2,1-aminomutase